MKYVFGDMSRIRARIGKGEPLLLLDFDLTLSPLARDPRRAMLPAATKDLLRKISKRIAVIIVTGRELKDIRRRAGVRGISYIGNHGLERELKGVRETAAVPVPAAKALSNLKRELRAVQRAFPEIVMEDKKYSVALGYRLVRPERAGALEKSLNTLARDIDRGGVLDSRLDKKTFEVRIKTRIHKGTACRAALEILQEGSRKRLVPVYVGDSQTDEDAFGALRREGITVRVGRNGKSRALWYLRDRAEVNKFLKWMYGQVTARSRD